MSDTQTQPRKHEDERERPPCDGNPDFSGLERRMQACMNCRKAVEESFTRVAGRKMRKLRNLPECAVDRCVSFLESVEDTGLRLHLASMAWWRFSSDGVPGAADRVRKIMTASVALPPDFGLPYLHKALKALSPLSQEQLTSWFGHETLFQLADLFSGGREEIHGKHCEKCRLYKMGCTAHSLIGADDCPLWNDTFVQGVAAAVKKAGTWKDPCRWLSDAAPEKKGV